MAQLCESAEIIEATAEAIWRQCPRLTGNRWEIVSQDDKAHYRAMAVSAIQTLRKRVAGAVS